MTSLSAKDKSVIKDFFAKVAPQMIEIGHQALAR